MVFIKGNIKFNNDSSRIAHFISFYLSTTIPHIFHRFTVLCNFYMISGVGSKVFFVSQTPRVPVSLKTMVLMPTRYACRRKLQTMMLTVIEFLTQFLLYLSVIVSNNVAYPVVVISCSPRVKRQCKSGRQDMGDDFIEKGEV